MRRTILPLTVALTALLIFSTAALAAIKIGTDNNDTVVGTNSADHITGKAGDDTLDGRAGNDVYHFAEGFGKDTLIEPKKVGGSPGGTDTLSFAGVTTQVGIRLIPQWRDQGYNVAGFSSDNWVALGASIIEKAVGGSASDYIITGSASNTLKGGAGGSDTLHDFGGVEGNSETPADLPASDDLYKGFAASSGFDSVVDCAGKGDVLDLKPWDSSDVYLDAFNTFGTGQADSLMISAGDRGVYVYGHFNPTKTAGLCAAHGNRTMEKIVFADETITSAPQVNALIKASAAAGKRAAVKRATPAPPTLDAAGGTLRGSIPRSPEMSNR